MFDAIEPVSKPLSPVVAKFSVADEQVIKLVRKLSKQFKVPMVIVVVLANTGAVP